MDDILFRYVGYCEEAAETLSNLTITDPQIVRVVSALTKEQEDRVAWLKLAINPSTSPDLVARIERLANVIKPVAR